MNENNNISFITFIIPTIGRKTIINTIESIINQTNNDWNAIIIFDGIKNTEVEINDSRIKVVEIENKIGIEGKRNFSGLVRNIGLNSVIDTEWIGFVDDDDILSKNYIAFLKKELINTNNKLDLIIFRMMYENGLVLPTKYDRNITKNRVGISFAFRKEIGCKYKFENSPYEDYLFLKNIQKCGFKILISSYIGYFIRCDEKISTELYPKIFINY